MLELYIGMWDGYENVSQKAVADGANEMIEACVVDTDEPMGGVARNLGNSPSALQSACDSGNGRLTSRHKAPGVNMDIDLVKAKPQIQCTGEPETPNVYKSCITLMNEMKDWFQDARFGTGDDVDVRLPYTEISCKISLNCIKLFELRKAFG